MRMLFYMMYVRCCGFQLWFFGLDIRKALLNWCLGQSTNVMMLELEASQLIGKIVIWFTGIVLWKVSRFHQIFGERLCAAWGFSSHMYVVSQYVVELEITIRIAQMRAFCSTYQHVQSATARENLLTDP